MDYTEGKTTHEEGFAEGTDRTMGLCADNPSVEYLNGLEIALLRALGSVREKKILILSKQSLEEELAALEDEEIDSYANDWKVAAS
jgi:hypothetical protein